MSEKIEEDLKKVTENGLTILKEMGFEVIAENDSGDVE